MIQPPRPINVDKNLAPAGQFFLFVVDVLATFVLLVDLFLCFRRRAEFHLPKDIGIRPIIGLCPAVVRMFMTLSTLEADAQQRGRGLFTHLFD